MNKERSAFIDILKAIGIISIVIGHGGAVITRFQINMAAFVYTYHLMIFIVTAGYCFKSEQISNPFALIGKRIKGLLPMYVGYCLFFACIHNIISQMQVVNDMSIYSLGNIIVNVCNAFAFATNDALLGAFWFVPVLLFADVFFILSFYVAEKCGKYSKYVHGLFIIGFALSGIYLNANGIYLQYHMQTSVIAVPFMHLGYWLKNNIDKVKKYCTCWGAIVAAAILAFSLYTTGGVIELGSNRIMSPTLFYPVSLVGIYFCMSVAATLEKINLTKTVFSYIGKNSFHIMALHFLVFKIFDYIYYHVTCMNDPSILLRFPCSFTNFWYIYYTLGTFIPLLMIFPIQKIKQIIKNKK